MKLGYRQQPANTTSKYKDFNIDGLVTAVKNFNQRYVVPRTYFDHDNYFVWKAFYTNEDKMDYYHNVSC
ncbi:hypothetical protein LFU01_17240 [Lysinibacillus fusiformis]|nr:hypothetical protein LFU01_17240 [Lysinibacillus fusiformis]